MPDNQTDNKPDKPIDSPNRPGTQPLTIAQMLEHGQALFDQSGLYFGHGTDNSWDEAVYLLSYVLDLGPNADRSLLENELTESQQQAIDSCQTNQ